MKQIVKPKELASKILLTQSETSSDRLSMYCLSATCEEGQLIYHNLTGEMILLEDAESRSFMDDDRVTQTLAKKHFLVSEQKDEYRLAVEFRKLSILMHRKKEAITKYTIFPTTDCNARCSYCYELGRKRLDMTEDVAHDTAMYIVDHCRGNKVKIQWFGGEPLLNYSAIDVISDELRNEKIKFTSKIVTNGYLFDDELISKALDSWNVDSVQITLDGTEGPYNRIKNYIYEYGSPYRRVIRNIGSLLDAGIRVGVRLNLDKKNADDLERLVDDLIESFGCKQGLSIYTVLIRDFGCVEKDFGRDEESLERYGELQQKLVDAGLCNVQTLHHDIRTNRCMADNDESITILPDGQIGKCEHESEKELIGSIYSNHFDLKMIEAWKDTVWIDECRNCLFYPNCIRLRKCAWVKDRCTEYDRKEMTINLKQRMLNEYNRYNKGNK